MSQGSLTVTSPLLSIPKALSIPDAISLKISRNDSPDEIPHITDGTRVMSLRDRTNIQKIQTSIGDHHTSSFELHTSAANIPLLYNQWTDIKSDWRSDLLNWIRTTDKLQESRRKSTSDTFTSENRAYDSLKYGWCKKPIHNYNPFVHTTLTRAGVSDDTDDDAISPKPDTVKTEEAIDLYTTLPIFNGGIDVRLRKCDGNTHTFSLKEKELATSWLSFEVWDDRVLTHNDGFIGVVSIDLSGIKDKGQVYYTQLPLINKQNYTREMQLRLEKEYKAYHNRIKSVVDTEVKDDEYKAIMTEETPEETSEDTDNEDHALKITGMLHVTGIKKIKRAKTDDFDNIEDVFDENRNECFDLEIEILAITTMKEKLSEGMDQRKFRFGIIGFILYLLFYALIMFVAEIYTSTGMNEYKESIWFALVTITTIGYGDIYAQTKYSKVLNSFFIAINVIIIAGFVSNLLGYVVSAGEDALDSRMNNVMDGAHAVFETNQKMIQPGLERRHDEKKKTLEYTQKERRKSQGDMKKLDPQQLKHKRTFSEPVLIGIDESPSLSEEEDEEEKQQRIDNANAMEVATTKATKVKLKQLTTLDTAETVRFKAQLYVNLALFFLTLLFGFFTLGVAILLEGPNYLTDLPYFGYECTDIDDPHCALHTSAGPVFVDSLYYSVVSMTTVGYGDIYPQSGPLPRIFGALFILFGTLMLVRLIDLGFGYLIWQRTTAQKKRCLAQLLTSSNDFFEFDLNDDDKVDEYEFLVGMLVKLDLVERDRINAIMALFDAIDIDGNGKVEMHELKEKLYEDRMKLKWGENSWDEIKRSWKTIQEQEEQIRIVKKELKEQEETLKKKTETFEKGKKIWEKQEETLKRKTKAFEKEKEKWEKQKQKEIEEIRSEVEKEYEEKKIKKGAGGYKSSRSVPIYTEDVESDNDKGQTVTVNDT